MDDPSRRDSALPYDRWLEGALRGVVRQALARVAESGLPGAHHFYLSFATAAPGVTMPAALRAQHPAEMTIVLQHQFWGLAVDDEAFAVTLSFHGAKADLRVPFAAVTAFADPAVNFGLQLKPAPGEAAAGSAAGATPAKPPTTAGERPAGKVAKKGAAEKRKAKSGEVVALESFRKK